MAREDYLPVLLTLFRQYGYDGVSLSKIAAATGLGKASLYHHFPGGKSEMLAAVLDWTEQWIEDNLLNVLRPEIESQAARTQETAMRSVVTPKQQFQQMCDRLTQLYDSGNLPCLLATLTTSATHDTFRTQIKARLQQLIEAITALLIASGLPTDIAQVRGEEAVISIQGSLILSRALEDPAPFQRAIAKLPDQLCQGIES